jgi:hypothetical protein
MEYNSEIWKESSITNIIKKLLFYETELRDLLLLMKDRALEDIPYNEMIEIFTSNKLLSHNLNLTKQEMLTLLRAMDKKRKGTVKYFRLFRLMNDEEMFSSWEQKSEGGGGGGFGTARSYMTTSESEFITEREKGRRRK